MILQFVAKILDCQERSAEELQKDANGPRYTGSMTIRKSKKTKGGARVDLEDVASYKSHEKLTAGDYMIEAELSAYSVNGNSGISCRILRVIKPAKV